MPRARGLETAADFTPGQLSYLPKRRYSDVCSLTGSEIPDGCYDHPVLILSTDSRKKEVVVLILTSLGGKNLDEKPSRVRAFHLPIYPAPAHPDNGILLFLDQDLALPKKTYVKTEVSRTIHWQLLQADYGEHRAGRRYNYKLRPDSFAKLLQHIKLVAPVGPGKPQAPETPVPAPVEYQVTTQDIIRAVRARNSTQHGFVSPLLTTQEIVNSVPANNSAQYGSISPSFPPLPKNPKPPPYSVRPPVAASTLQSVARSREGVAVETDRYIAQWRESQTREARRQQEHPSLLPTYHSYTPPSNDVVGSGGPRPDLRRLFVVLLLMVGGFLIIAWWRCQLWTCKK